MPLLPLVVALICVLPAKADGPFVALDYGAATARARTENKLLLVDFTATWCPPCKQMDKVTWPDEAVAKWIGEHAIAIQVDVDKAPELAKTFGFQAIPTVIFLKDGKELDRHTGFRPASEFLAWGDAVLAGRSEVKEAAASAKDLLQSDDVDARYKAASLALENGDYDLALQHYLWLWPHTREATAYGGVRLSFMLGDMAQLANVHPPARKAFGEILDGLQKKIDAEPLPAFEDWQEWSSMCQYFGERRRVVSWYEARRDKDGRLLGGDTDDLMTGLVTDEVFEALLEANRPVDAVRLYRDVTGRARKAVADYTSGIARVPGFPEEMRDSMRDYEVSKCRDDLSTLHAAALAATQPDRAATIAKALLDTLDDAPSRLELVKRTLDLAPGQTAGLATWLDEAEKLGADVTELRARLAKAPPAPAVPSKSPGG